MAFARYFIRSRKLFLQILNEHKRINCSYIWAAFCLGIPASSAAVPRIPRAQGAARCVRRRRRRRRGGRRRRRGRTRPRGRPPRPPRRPGWPPGQPPGRRPVRRRREPAPGAPDILPPPKAAAAAGRSGETAKKLWNYEVQLAIYIVTAANKVGLLRSSRFKENVPLFNFLLIRKAKSRCEMKCFFF